MPLHPRQFGEQTLFTYSLPSGSQWEWDLQRLGLMVPSVYAAQGLLALPVTATPMFVAHEDPSLEIEEESPMNMVFTKLSTAPHLLQRPFWTMQEMEDAHKEALGIACDRRAGIFDYNRPVGGRIEDPPDRKILREKPQDIEWEGHILLWTLLSLTLMVNRVKAAPEGIIGKSLYVMTQGYIESITPVPKLPHREFLVASLRAHGVALSVFCTVSMDIPDVQVAKSSRAFPRPLVVHRMPMKRASLWLIFSTVILE